MELGGGREREVGRSGVGKFNGEGWSLEVCSTVRWGGVVLGKVRWGGVVWDFVRLCGLDVVLWCGAVWCKEGIQLALIHCIRDGHCLAALIVCISGIMKNPFIMTSASKFHLVKKLHQS